MKINSKHRVLSIILSVLMVLSLMPVAVFADDGSSADAIEYWTNFDASTGTTFSSLDEALTHASKQTDATRRVVISGDYTLSTDISIPDGVYLDVIGHLTISDGVTLTVPANAKRFGVWTGGTVDGNGQVLVYGRGTNYAESKVMVNGTMDLSMIKVPEGYVVGKNANSYYAAKPIFEITLNDGTVKEVTGTTDITSDVKSVKLLADYNKSWSVEQTASGLVLDLNGFTWRGQLEIANTEVTIKNGTVENNNSDYGAIWMYGSTAAVTIAGDAVINGTNGMAIRSQSGKLTVNGTVNANGGYAIAGNGDVSGGNVDSVDIIVNDGAVISAPNGIGIYHPQKGTVTVNSGSITGHTGIEMCAGKLVVNGGTITSSGDNYDATGSQNAILDGAAISIINRNYPGGIPAAEINGGIITAGGKEALAIKAYDYTQDIVAAWENVKDYVAVTAGTFSSDVSAYLADGYDQTENDDGTFAVESAGYIVDANGNVTISSAKGLLWFANEANSGNNFAGKTVKLANDIDLNDKLWIPIGIYNDSKTHFKGTFDGQGHTVSGVNVVESRKNGVGFFGKVYTGTIKNLTVVGNITTDNCNYVGGIVGHGYATVVDCVFRGNVGSANTMQVGGIAGSGGFTVTRCSVYGNVTAECWAGGIVGNCQDGGSYTDCYVEGEINAERTYWGGGAAGITPVPLYPSQVITGCYSNTVVKVAGKEVNCPIIATYNNPLDYNGYTGGLKIYDNSWNKQKNPNDSYPLYAEKNGVGGVLVEGGDVARDNNLVMLDDDLNYVDDLSKVRIMSGSSVTQGQVDALAVAKVGEIAYTSLDAAFEAAKDGDTVTLLADITEDVVINKNITFDLGGKTITNTGAGKATLTVASGATATVKNGSIVGGASYYNIQNNGTAILEGITATAGNTGSSMIDNWGTLTITSGTYTGGLNVVKSEEGSTLVINGGDFTLDYSVSNSYNAVIFVYGDTTINGGTFTQSLTTAGKWAHPQVVATGVVEGYTAITRVTGGKFTNKKSGEAIFRGVGKATSDNFEVSGGSFNKSIGDGYCADGFIPTKNADGTYGVKAGKYVASIGSKNYETLADAIRLAAKGKTVTLLCDIDENVTVAATKNITIDLNGYTLNGGTGTSTPTILNLGTLTITDSSAGKTGTIKRADSGIEGETIYYDNINKGTMTIENAIVTNNSGYKKTNPSGSMVGSSLICNEGTDATESAAAKIAVLNIKGGTFTQYNFIAVKNSSNAELNISGGVINSKHSAVQNWYNANITGGVLNGQLWTDAWDETSTGKTVVSGDAKLNGEIVMDITGSIAPTLEIAGGSHNVTWKVTTAASNAGAKPQVSGGTFTTAVSEDYCADGFIPTQNEDGTYGVKIGTYVAETGGVKYESLEEAINAATRGKTVTMLADTRENVTISKNLILDLNGFTINGGQVKGKATVMIDNARVTIMDSSAGQTGTIMREDTAENSGDSSYYVIDIQGKNGFLKFTGGNVKNDSGIVGVKGASLVRLGDDSVAGAYPTLTIYGGTFTQNNFVAIKVDRGTLHFVGGVITSANSYAVENWNNAYIKGGTVNGTVSSWVYSTGAAFSKLEISGGTVNGNVASVNYDSAADKQARIFVTGGTVTGTLGKYTYTNGLVPTDEAAMATIEVTAGTFEKNPTKYVVEGSAVKTNDDGTFGVEKAYLAKVGDTSYYTMDEAFHAALNSGETLYLLRDYTTATEQNSGSKNLTIDLGGHTWTYTGTDTNCAAFEINYSDVTLTVKNGTVISNTMVGLIPTAMSGSITYNNSALVFENVAMTANGRSGIETNGGNTNDNVTLINSTLNVPNGYGIYFPSSGTLTINNSVINAKTMGVQICAGSLNIVGDGTKITVTGDGIEKTENDGAIEDGAAISIVDRTGYKGLESIKIEAGTFVAKDGNDALKAYKWENKTESAFDNANNTVAVSGGTFSSAVKKEYCADGYKSVTDSNGNYTVKEANITVKVSSNISAAGTLTGGDMYAKGETVTVTATVNPGYVFLGWYDASGKLVNANTTYTFEAAESVDLIATFKGNKNVKLSVGLSGGIVTVSGDVTAKWRNDVKDNEFLLGTSFVLTAAPRAGYTFLYWINSEGRILSDEPEYKFTLGMDTSIKACFMETEQWEDSSYVIFRDNITKKIIWSGDVEMTAHSDGIYGTVAAPALLNYSGVTFKDWRDADGNVVTPDENGNIRITSNVTIYAIYQATSDTFDVTVDGETVGSYGFRTSVSVTAPETKDGKYFAGWYRDGVLVSTNATYSFIIRSATALTTEYTDIKQEPASVAILTVGDREQTERGVLAPFSLDWSLAEGCELVKVGIIRTYDASLKDKLTLENVNGSTIKTKESVLTTSDGNYLYNLTLLPETAVNDVYMTGYVMYRAANGNIITLYTDVVTSPAGN